jgi:hypothetical protein
MATKKATKKADQKPKAEPKKAAKKVEKTIPELITELHARFTAVHGESYRARQCSRLTNKLKRLVIADDILKG